MIIIEFLIWILNEVAKELDDKYLAVGCHIKTMDIILILK
jgi:hypothetical protein